MVGMVKPSTPGKKLVELLVSKQGGGKTRRLRSKVTAAEVAEAVTILRTCCPDANLLDPEQSHALCKKVLAAALAPDRAPHPDQNWDLVAVYAGLQKIERGEACVELGLAVKVTEPEPELTPIEKAEKQLAQARRIADSARKRGDPRLTKAAENMVGMFWVALDMLQHGFGDSPLPSPPSSAPPAPSPPASSTPIKTEGEGDWHDDEGWSQG